MATLQVNLKFQDTFFEKIQKYTEENGYMSIQELIREAVRDKIEDEIRPEYMEFLKHSKEANTFLSDKEAQDFEQTMKKRAKLK